MSFTKRLAAIRKERGLTQQQMSEVIGIHLSQVKHYESGDTQPSLEHTANRLSSSVGGR